MCRYALFLLARSHMAQNFDGGKFWRTRIKKILTSKKLTNANVFNLLSCLLHSHLGFLVIHIYSYVVIKPLILVCTCICTCINCNWYKHKPATSFLGSHRSMHVISHRGMCIDWFLCMPVWWLTEMWNWESYKEFIVIINAWLL